MANSLNRQPVSCKENSFLLWYYWMHHSSLEISKWLCQSFTFPFFLPKEHCSQLARQHFDCFQLWFLYTTTHFNLMKFYTRNLWHMCWRTIEALSRKNNVDFLSLSPMAWGSLQKDKYTTTEISVTWYTGDIVQKKRNKLTLWKGEPCFQGQNIIFVLEIRMSQEIKRASWIQKNWS